MKSSNFTIDVTMNKLYVVIFSILFLHSFAFSFQWNIESSLYGIMDNREFSNSIVIPQTFFGAIGRLETGVTIDSNHTLQCGFAYFKEFGKEEHLNAFDLILYYNGKYQLHNFYFGAFPYEKIGVFPDYLFSDSSRYYRPVLEGAFYQASFKKAWINIWIDWTSRQTEKIHETFLVGTSGELFFKPFFTTFNFLYYHYAGRKNVSPSDPVQDNVGFISKTGTRFSNIAFLDSLSFSLNFLLAYDRLRTSYSWRSPVIPAGELSMSFRKLKAQFLFYNGAKKRQTTWKKNIWGDNLYQSKRFCKIALSFSPVLLHHIFTTFTLDTYFIEKQVDFRQTLYVHILFSKTTSINKNSTH